MYRKINSDLLDRQGYIIPQNQGLKSIAIGFVVAVVAEAALFAITIGSCQLYRAFHHHLSLNYLVTKGGGCAAIALGSAFVGALGIVTTLLALEHYSPKYPSKAPTIGKK